MSEEKTWSSVTTDDDRKLLGDGLQLDHLLPKMSYHSLWDSPEAYARYIETLNPSQSWNGPDAWTSTSEFYGQTKNMKETLSLCQNGWKEGAEKIEALRAYIKAANPRAPRLIRHGLAGATPNVPRAVAGNLFNMRQPGSSESRKKPVITLVANMSASCGIDSEMISNRAATLAAIIDEIEASGFSCEVIATAMSQGRAGFRAATSVIVKPSHQPVDVMKLAFSLGHASFFRRMIFADWETQDVCQKGLGYGLGTIRTEAYKRDQEALLEKAIYMLPSNQERSEYFKDDVTAMEKGLPFILQHLKELGCPPFKALKEWKDPDFVEPPKFPTWHDDEDDDRDF